MSYRIGLDIGIASVGWSVFETDEFGEPKRLKNLGVRVFETAENPKDGASLAQARRAARSVRRHLRRRRHRLVRIRDLIESAFGEDIASIENSGACDVHEARKKALDEDISAEALGAILVYFCKHRGFISNRKSEANDKDAGKLLKSVGENHKIMEEKGYRTIGEMIYFDDAFFTTVDGRKIYNIRNHEGDYSKSFFRVDLKAELEQILARQKTPLNLSDEFIKKTLDIFMSQRSFDEGPGGNSKYRIVGYDVGQCQFESGEIRAPKASFSAEYANALQKINNLSYEVAGKEAFLTDEEKQKLIDIAKTKKELTFAGVKKQLSLPLDATFNLLSYSDKGKTQEEIEKGARLFSMACSYEIRGKLAEQNKNYTELIDRVGEILSLYKSDDNRRRYFAEVPALSSEETEALLELDFSKFGNLSLKALRNIIPYLEQGQKYSDACTSAGYAFRGHTENTKHKKLKCKEVHDIVAEVGSPAARRSISQAIKVINAIIDKEGCQPCGVNIELARDMALNKAKRDGIDAKNKKNAEINQRAAKEITEKFGIPNPKAQDILKYKLYEEQGGKCAYSTESFDVERLFESGYAEIDHIIPYSRSFDDSFNNKVLVLKKENQDKRNRIPYEHFGSDSEKWSKFEAFVNMQYKGKSENATKNFKKATILLKKKFDDKDRDEWKNRALNDTRYICSVMLNLINDYLELETIPGKKKQVISVNGSITAYLRRVWGLPKSRVEGDKHHALDASVIAMVTDGVIKKVTEYAQIKDMHAKWDPIAKKYLYLGEGGELFDSKNFDEKYGYNPAPYKEFRDELLIRLSDNPLEEMHKRDDALAPLGYTEDEINRLQPIFVSRMANRKIMGAIHKDTIMSARAIDSGKSSNKVAINKLKLNKTKDGIEGYNEKAQNDDKLLYNALLKRLQDFGGNGEEAFKEPFYKPKADGTRGNLVKKVWIDSVFNNGVKLENRKVLAANDRMVRIDVFTKNGKYYVVPIYTKDVYANVLPNRAITRDRKYNQWDEMDESYEFLFSLFSRDLVYIEEVSPLKLCVANKDSKKTAPNNIYSGLFYYIGMDVSTGAAYLINHDHSLETRKGFKTIFEIKKYQVDILGNVTEAGKEKRQGLNSIIEKE